MLTPRVRSCAKSIVPPPARYGLHVALCAATSLTIRDRELVRKARELGSRPCRVLGGDLRGWVLFNPVGQTSPAHVLGHFESHVADAMRTHISPGDVVYDVGANVGWHTLRLAKLTGAAGEVHAFEPTPRDQALLGLNLAVNHVDVVRVRKIALSDEVGSVEFATFSSPGVNHIADGEQPADAQIIQVDATTLDEYVFGEGHPAPTFVKMDVEGGEMHVLAGADRVITDHRPVFVVEVRREVTAERVDEFFSAHGYRASELWGDEYLADILFTPEPADAAPPMA